MQNVYFLLEECLFIQDAAATASAVNTHEDLANLGPFGNCFFHAFRIFYAHKVDHKVINALKCDIKTLQGNNEISSSWVAQQKQQQQQQQQ